MRRRSFFLGLGALACGGALVSCGGPAEASPSFDAAATYRRLAALDLPRLTRLIAAASPQGQAIARGFWVYYGQREVDSFGAPTLAYMLAPGYHRLAYHLFASEGEARGCYADFVTNYLEELAPPLPPPPAFPYPASLLASGERGVAAVQIGPVVLNVIAAGTNPGFLTTLVVGGTAHLERLLANAR